MWQTSLRSSRPPAARPLLAGKSVALMFSKASTRTRAQLCGGVGSWEEWAIT